MIGIGDCTRQYVVSRWKRGEITQQTKLSFSESLRGFAAYMGAETSISSVQRRDVARWLEKLEVSPATKRLRLSTLRGMYKWAVIEGHTKVDPTLGIKGPKKPRTVPRGLSSDQFDLVIENSKDVRERLIVTLMYEEGLRACGVAALQLGDIDLHSKTMVVTEKGDHERRLPITDEALDAIHAYLMERGRKPGKLIQSYQQSYAHDDDGITPKYIVHLVGEALRRVGIEESGHVLRHSFAHGMIDNGASIRDVQQALGHASLVTTQVYLGFAEVKELRQFMGRRNRLPEPEIDEMPAALGGIA